MGSLNWREAADWCKALYLAGLSSPPWTEARATYWAQSLECFINWFIGPGLPMPEFHREWCYLLCRYQFLCLLAPRDHAKTTVASIYYPLWRIYMDQNSTILLAASAGSVAALSLRAIKGHVESNLRLRQGFGDIKPAPDEMEKWTQTEIVVKRSNYTLKDPTIVAVGVGGSILTRRISNGFFVADDIVQDDEVLTEAGRERVRLWVNGVLIPVLEPGEQGVFIGTRKHDRDFYAELMDNPAFEHRVYDAHIDDSVEPWVTLWPEKWPQAALQARQQAIGTIQYNRNYRNMVLSDTDSPFPLSWFRGGERGLRGCFDWSAHMLDVHWGTDMVKVAGVDLAIGEGENSAYFVVMVWGLDARGDFPLIHMVRTRLSFPEQVRKIIELYDRFVPEAIVVENNAYQEAMLQTLKSMAPHLPVIPHTTTRRKHHPQEGVPMLQPLVEAGRLRLPMGDPQSRAMSEIVVSEFNRLGVGKFSDTVMATWFAIKRLVNQTERRPTGAIVL